VPTREKYVPRHRDVADRSALRTGLRNTLVASGVAAAATGISVSTGVLNSDGALTTTAVASELKAPTDGAGKLTVDDLLEREQAVSRSAGDRRTTVDKAKVSALADTSGRARTRVERIKPTDPKDLARALMPEYGLSAGEFGCLDNIWSQESGWNIHADNPSSSAYGIPQALPGSKMSSAGPDWANNAETQIRWGLGYIRDRYGSACGAWSFKSGHGWY
jgi:hypothetical protein